ncbi:uncharacterized protein LOC120626682 [Pararge aegeria]|uniref:Jg2514 protein n=1 Tax=Pararge aegeria aegeria TaxID=348720 RepID=A0A8S4RY16_9NEOP|nr:uncharacterized protein LOC120626682 [Pararge aegeria]CAH2244004.1 jg2514 [Pararge aegeria aegeria]
MYKHYILALGAIFCCAQCLPLDATHSESTSTSQLHLVVNNSTQSTNYHLTPVMSELENIDQQIDDQLKAILPYLNFFFDSLLGQPKSADEDDCINDMVIELVPDETASPSTTSTDNKSDQKSEDKSATNPDTANTKENANDKPLPKPDADSTPDKAAKKIQSNS